MNLRLRLSPRLLSFTMGLSLSACSWAQSDKTDFGAVAGTVVNMLMDNHYSRRDFDNELSKKALQNYIDYYDYNRLYFTKAEIESFHANYETKLDDYVALNKIDPAKEIFKAYAQHLKDRAAKIRELLQPGKLDFNTKEEASISRKDAPWANSEAELDELWKRQITREVLQERLKISLAALRKKEKTEAEVKKADATGQPAPATEAAPLKPEEAKPFEDAKDGKAKEKMPDTPEQKVQKRYDSFLKIIQEYDDEDITNFFLSAIASAYDPHSEYLSAPEEDRFKIEMKKSVIGIGAELGMKDGAAEIRRVVPTGPADKSGAIHVGDLITGVGEGAEGELKNLDGLKLQKIVELIRGSENTTVRLRIIPADDPTTFREVRIVRQKVEIKDTLAKAELIEMNKPGAAPLRIGWIQLESFYGDMENSNRRGAMSATGHVRALLNRLQKENISGLVLDLRGNGGGFLEEAIRLSGLFIKSGPVVQQRDNRDRTEPRFSRGSEPVYSGPLVVVTDRASASASEICAAALQDYGRAVVVGDKTTFGKGTVQTILPVADQMPLFSEHDRAGSLKVTIQKFYRINGWSTQHKGVAADVVLPSRYDAMEVGESFLKDPLPYDVIKTMKFDMAPTNPLPIADLKSRSEARVTANPEFKYITDYVTRTHDIIKKNTLSLNENDRIAEDTATEATFFKQKQERKTRIAEANKTGDPYTVFPLTLDTLGEATLKTDAQVKKDAKPEARLSPDDGEGDPTTTADDEETFPHGIEPVKAETLQVVRDLIELTTQAPKNTAKRD
ncbi:MAG: prc [Verrucomicrobiales bacterium]|nr:prc [Verrucomicrobiales bacterium]